MLIIKLTLNLPSVTRHWISLAGNILVFSSNSISLIVLLMFRVKLLITNNGIVTKKVVPQLISDMHSRFPPCSLIISLARIGPKPDP
jgi:hypothetical protein